MSYRYLLTRRDGPIEYVTLNRPDVRNAFNEDVIAEVTAWCEGILAGGPVRCAVIGGAGPVFCAGADLAWMSKMVAFSHEENLADANAAARMYASLDRLPVPLIGRVQGAALGGGAGIAAVCDVVVAEEGAIFGFTEVKFGIVPAMISPYVLAKIGESATRHLFITGARFSAQHAREVGLVHSVVPAADLDAQVAHYAREMLSCGPEAIATVKTLLREIAHRQPADAVGITAEAIAARRVSREGQDGMTAFLEKRKAAWNVSPDPDRQPR
jgi:methylglutaconyl-CoA hydratase